MRMARPRSIVVSDGKSELNGTLALLLIALAAGCRSIPFEPVPRYAMDAYDPETVRMEFDGSSPRRYRQVNSVVFSFWWKKLTALGMLEVDRDTGTFKLACMTPVGMKLFDFEGKSDETTCLFAIDQMGGRPEVTASVGDDIRAVYLDIVPDASAHVHRRSKSVVFSRVDGNRRVEHEFTGNPPVLIEKRLHERGYLVRRVRYYEYAEQNRLRYPRGIVLDNKQYHYRLIIRVKEMRE